jgi:hypothetical protein
MSDEENPFDLKSDEEVVCDFDESGVEDEAMPVITEEDDNTGEVFHPDFNRSSDAGLPSYGSELKPSEPSESGTSSKFEPGESLPFKPLKVTGYTTEKVENDNFAPGESLPFKPLKVTGYTSDKVEADLHNSSDEEINFNPMQ